MKTITRRRMISGLGAGLAAAAPPRIFAAQNVSKEDVMTTQKLEDPKNRYPKPPFKEQQQPWPALASKMDPRPDHGDKRHKGQGRLVRRQAAITGGDSGIRRGAVIPLAREDPHEPLN